MKNLQILSLVACATLVFSACKVQSAAGAYIPAEGEKPKQEVLAEKPKEEEPKPAPVVEEQPVVVEKEVTRAETFSVVEGEKETELKTYHVVIGSFKSQENAKKLQARERPAYNPVIVINEQGMYRVILISFDEYAAAKQKIAAIRDQYSDAWVLVQKK